MYCQTDNTRTFFRAYFKHKIMRYSKPQLEEMLLTVSETIDHYSTNCISLQKINEGLEKQNDLLRQENEVLKRSVSAIQINLNSVTVKAKE